jgi:predicted nucleic acid-binding protein
VIFDTNILIYISKNILKVENFITQADQPKISVISYIEALGFSFSTQEEHVYMQRICDSCKVIHLSDKIVQETIRLRKGNRIKLPDAVIYAIALCTSEALFTNNLADFRYLGTKVELVNPLAL